MYALFVSAHAAIQHALYSRPRRLPLCLNLAAQLIADSPKDWEAEGWDLDFCHALDLWAVCAVPQVLPGLREDLSNLLTDTSGEDGAISIQDRFQYCVMRGGGRKMTAAILFFSWLLMVIGKVIFGIPVEIQNK